MSVTTLIINLVLFAWGFKTLKKSTIVKNLAGIMFLSLFLQLTESLVYTKGDILIASVFGGILVGIGVGLVMLKDGSTGGSDFAALIIHKALPHISVANIILAIDTLVILALGFAFENFNIVFYSVISVFISSKVTDFILVSGEKAKSVYIVSEKSNEISDEIMRDMERGVTGIYSKGCYNNTDRTMLMCIVKSKEVKTVLKIVKKWDKSAFTIISEVREVRGEGFKDI
jgi:uncharacterized membrane-anchored protein YitT (DUF2179 family)